MKNIFLFASLIIAFAFTTNATAQKFSGLDKSPVDIATYATSKKAVSKAIKVVYSRPQLKGRAIGTELAKYGKVWRTGANESSEITFYIPVSIGGKTVNAGTYSLFTIPGKNEWTVIINKSINQWGAYSYNEKNDVVRVKVPVTSGSSSIEAFSIAFDDKGKMVLAWGKTRVAVPIFTEI